MDLRDLLQASLGTAYRIEHELTGGGMSRVFVATEKAYDRKVVVKVLPPELVQGVSVERFKREIQLAAQLQHPHIVPLLTSGEIDGLPFYTMPFVEGTSLRARIAKGGALPIGDAVNVLREVARALAYAHERGIVHRDIKPDNVLLSGGSAVVTDFGIAKALSVAKTVAPGGTLTQMGTSIGTPTYMAPEQAAGDPDTDHRADLYAFACMAFEMLTGEPPFTARAPQKLLAAHMAEAPRAVTELRPDTPPLLAELITRCLEKEPDRRPQHAQDLVKVLETVSTASGGANPTMPAILLSGRPRVVRALAVYAAAFVAAVILAKAAVVGIGLPEWVVPGTILVMALGLPAILLTAFVHHGAHQAMTMANVTPGGTPAVRSTMARFAVKASPWVTWRRTVYGGAAALASLVFLTGGYMTMRELGIGPAASLMSTGAIAASDRIIIADFESPADDSTLGPVVTDAFRSDLSQSRELRVVEATMVRNVLQRMQRPATTRVDYAVAREIAAREGIKAVMDGEVLGLGGSYVIAAKLYAAQTGEVLATFRVTANDARELIPAIGRLTREVRGKVGESLRTVHATRALEQVTTPSLDALRKYVQAVRITTETSDADRAIALLEEAVAIDTSFASAYRKLAIELLNRGGQNTRAREAIEKAYRHRERLSDVERHLTTAAYYTVGPKYDAGRAIEAYQALLEIDPRNTTALNNLSVMYLRERRFAEAEQAAQQAIAVGPPSRSNFINLTSARLSQGKVDSARALVALERKVLPSSTGPLLNEGLILMVTGQYDSAETYLRTMMRTRGNEPGVRRLLRRDLAGVARVRGKLKEATRLTGEFFADRRDVAGPLITTADDAYARALALGDLAGAERIMDEGLRATPLDKLPLTDRPYVSIAQVYALVGRPQRIRALLEDDQRARAGVVAAGDSARRSALRALEAFADRRYADAVAHGRRADQGQCMGCTLPMLGSAYDQLGQADSARAVYERYLALTEPQRPGTDEFYLPVILQRLGEIHEARGEAQRAASYYARLVALWKDADPELQPTVTEIRRRLQRIQSRTG